MFQTNRPHKVDEVKGVLQMTTQTITKKIINNLQIQLQNKLQLGAVTYVSEDGLFWFFKDSAMDIQVNKNIDHDRYKVCIKQSNTNEKYGFYGLIESFLVADTIEQINSELQIIKLSGQKFAVNKSSYIMPKGFALYHPIFGFLGFSDGITPYQPKGGKKVLESILEQGGFISFDTMKWWKPIAI